ncbi:MAG: hypothetical protein AAFZ52_19140, partial [Bacteroidota bacterium]
MPLTKPLTMLRACLLTTLLYVLSLSVSAQDILASHAGNWEGQLPNTTDFTFSLTLNHLAAKNYRLH